MFASPRTFQERPSARHPPAVSPECSQRSSAVPPRSMHTSRARFHAGAVREHAGAALQPFDVERIVEVDVSGDLILPT